MQLSGFDGFAIFSGGGHCFSGGGWAEPRGDADAAKEADRRGLLSRRHRRRAERDARRGGQGLPDQTPFLRIETGMHTAVIKLMGVDAACARIATASDDKTVRLWSLPDGKLQRTIRLPIGPGDGGKVFAAALSPDGRRIAAGGSDASFLKLGSHSLSVIDLDLGLIRRVGTFPNEFTASPSPRTVLAWRSAWTPNGIRVYDWTSGKELFADRDYAADIYGLAFAPDGSLIASSYDGQLRRYGKGSPPDRQARRAGGQARVTRRFVQNCTLTSWARPCRPQSDQCAGAHCVLFSARPRPPAVTVSIGASWAMETTLSRKWTKSRTRGRKLHLTEAKARVG